jgi:uridine kinase
MEVLIRKKQPKVVGVAGGSGSGKTTVVDRIVERLGADQVTCIQHDSYYVDRGDLAPEERAGVNYDHPSALETTLLVEHLRRLMAGAAVEVPVYDFRNHVRTPETVRAEPRSVILLEGILILADAALRELMDIKVYVDTDPDVRVIRRLERDIAGRQRTFDSVVKQYMETVRPMHLEFVEPSRRYADIFVPEGGYNEVAVDMLFTKIDSIINEPEPETPTA